MEVRNVMTSELKSVDAEQSVTDAARLMAEEDFGAAPVVEGGRLVGMLTDRDIVVRGVAAGGDVGSMKCAELMSGKAYSCRQDENVDDVAARMSQLQVRRMPVVDADENLVGIVSLGDLATRGAEKSAGDALQGISEPA